MKFEGADDCPSCTLDVEDGNFPRTGLSYHVVADQAIMDVSAALGYDTIDEYNSACEHKPDEVKERIRKL